MREGLRNFLIDVIMWIGFGIVFGMLMSLVRHYSFIEYGYFLIPYSIVYWVLTAVLALIKRI